MNGSRGAGLLEQVLLGAGLCALLSGLLEEDILQAANEALDGVAHQRRRFLMRRSERARLLPAARVGRFGSLCQQLRDDLLENQLHGALGVQLAAVAVLGQQCVRLVDNAVSTLLVEQAVKKQQSENVEDHILDDRQRAFGVRKDLWTAEQVEEPALPQRALQEDIPVAGVVAEQQIQVLQGWRIVRHVTGLQ